jgi:hypothetical protein
VSCQVSSSVLIWSPRRCHCCICSKRMGGAPLGLPGCPFAWRAEATSSAVRRKADTCLHWLEAADLPSNSTEKVIQSSYIRKNDCFILK